MESATQPAGPAGPAVPEPTLVRGLIPPTGNSDPRRRLGDIIVELGYADRELIEQVMTKEAESGRPVGELLVGSGIVDSTQLAHALAERNNLDFVDMRKLEVDPRAVKLMSTEDAGRFRAVPVALLEGGSLLVVTGDPSNKLAMEDVAMKTGHQVRLAIAAPEAVDALIARGGGRVEMPESGPGQGTGAGPGHAVDIDRIVEEHGAPGEAPIVKLVHAIITQAVQRGASDIHFDPQSGDMRVRFRIDGVAVDSTTVPQKLVPGLISRIKIMAELDIAERRKPQDGRVTMTVDGRQIDIRVATLPVIRGESAVLRILDKERVVLELEKLGMRDRDRELVRHAIRQIQGCVLVTGPTGAGKTTSLYAMLTEINTPEKTVISIEDPVEYEVDGVKQIHVNDKVGLSFAAGLRSMVRSDPDALMVGEIRDAETAQIAIEAALTGHLVLSTLHTNDAPGAAARLVDMGIEPYLVASGIECVVAQRLGRRLCEQCKRPATVSLAPLGPFPEGTPLEIPGFEPVGCTTCNNTGYKGRVGFYEVMVMNEELRSMIVKKAPSPELGAAAEAAGMQRLRDDGVEKVRQGYTSVPEVLRILGD